MTQTECIRLYITSIETKGKHGLTSNEEEATELVTDFLKKIFNQEKRISIPDIKEMKMPFTEDEIEKAIKSLKNEKSAGIDNITAEQLKYGSSLINKGIATL